MVLRPNLLSIYADEEEVALLFSTPLCDVTAVAEREPKKSRFKPKSSLYRRGCVFGIFTLSKNHYFEAPSPAEMTAWVATINREIPSESSADEAPQPVPGVAAKKNSVTSSGSAERGRTSGQGPSTARLSLTRPSVEGSAKEPRTSRLRNSHSGSRPSRSSADGKATNHNPAAIIPVPQLQGLPQHLTHSRPPRASIQGLESIGNANPGRIILDGYLHCQTTRKGISSGFRGMHGSKKYWVVLRPHSICFYKGPHERKVKNVIHTWDILAAAEIDLTHHHNHHKSRNHSTSSQKNTTEKAFQQAMNQSRFDTPGFDHRAQTSLSLSALSSASASSHSLSFSPPQPPDVTLPSSPPPAHDNSKTIWGFQIITRDFAWQFRAPDEASLAQWLGVVKTTANAARQGERNVDGVSDDLNRLSMDLVHPSEGART